MKIIMLAFILFISCSKKDKPTPEQTNTIPLTVVEPVSELPVKDAQVIFFECTAGCVGSVDRFIGITDENGICNVPSVSFSNSSIEMNIVKEGYWPFIIPAQRSRKVTLSPEGWVKISVHSNASYPLGSKLLLLISPKRLEYGNGELTDYPAVQDTFLLIKGYGGERNRINWQLVDENFDLVSYDSIEVDVARFVTSEDTVSLNY